MYPIYHEQDAVGPSDDDLAYAGTVELDICVGDDIAEEPTCVLGVPAIGVNDDSPDVCAIYTGLLTTDDQDVWIEECRTLSPPIPVMAVDIAEVEVDETVCVREDSLDVNTEEHEGGTGASNLPLWQPCV